MDKQLGIAANLIWLITQFTSELIGNIRFIQPITVNLDVKPDSYDDDDDNDNNYSSILKKKIKDIAETPCA